MKAALTIGNIVLEPVKVRKGAYTRLKDLIIKAKYAFSVEMHLMNRDGKIGHGISAQEKGNQIMEANKNAL